LLWNHPTVAFKPWNHDYIVKHALKQVKVVTPDGQELRFSDSAIEEIQDADKPVDFVIGGPREFWKSELHCDMAYLQISWEADGVLKLESTRTWPARHFLSRPRTSPLWRPRPMLNK